MKKCFKTASVLMVMSLIFSFGCQKAKVEEDGVNDLTLNTNEQAADTGEAIAVMTPGTVSTIALGSTDFSVEVAKTNEERAHGLMGRETLPANGGMWFVFPNNVQDEFWMKDTLMPLDIIYIDENMKVVHINPNTVPESTEMLSSPAEYRYVLEVAAGSAEKYDIKIGDIAEERIGPQ